MDRSQVEAQLDTPDASDPLIFREVTEDIGFRPDTGRVDRPGKAGFADDWTDAKYAPKPHPGGAK